MMSSHAPPQASEHSGLAAALGSGGSLSGEAEGGPSTWELLSFSRETTGMSMFSQSIGSQEHYWAHLKPDTGIHEDPSLIGET